MSGNRDVRIQNTRQYRSLFALTILFASLLCVNVWGTGQVINVHNALPDFDSRSETIAPTAQQIGIVNSLGAKAQWNKFGTPKSLIKYGGYLATGLNGDPTTAALNWIGANKALFRLSDTGPNSLELVNDSLMAGYDGHAVIFRQKFGTLPSGVDGLITIGITNGKIAYVSSSSAGDQPAPGGAVLDPVTAWLNAATSIGQVVSLANISGTHQENSWTVFDVFGFSHPQRSRLVAFPTVSNGVRPAYETNVLNVQAGSAIGYTLFVDAQSGQVLMRTNRVQQQAGGGTPSTEVFNGSYSVAPNACGECHIFAVPIGTANINVIASAAIVTNDIVLNMYRGDCSGSLLQSIDTATSPEAVINQPISPATSTEENFSVEVCPFIGTVPQTAPYNYVGVFTSSPVAAQGFFFPPKWDFVVANPKLDLSSTDVRVRGCWVTSGIDINKDTSDCDVELQNLASRVPWDHSVQGNAATNTTIGNNASSSQAWASPLTPAENYRPVSPTRDYLFAWENKWKTQGCNPAALVPPNGNDVDSATANLFSEHNRMHDWSYFLGFTERNFNMQTNNFGLTAPGPFPLGGEQDQETGNVQAGALTGYPAFLGRDNANQITLQDGIPGITNMYLWQPISGAFYAPCVDGDFDMSVIGHEYTHAISNRMIGGPDSGIVGEQGGAMGESWSDLSAVEILNEYSDYVPGNPLEFPTSDENAFAVGPYVTGNKERGIRNYNMGRNVAVAGFHSGPPQVLPPTSPLTTNNPLNYSNVGYDFVCEQNDLGDCIAYAQVHADGEIWSATNYDIRQSLINKYNGSYPASNKTLQRDCANGKLPANQCPGNRRWIQIMFDAFLLMQSDVDMLSARDAYLGADLMRFGSPGNQTELWRVFARRGMGLNASTIDSDDVDPKPSFESPNESEIGFKFKIVDSNGVTPIPNAKVFVGHYEARTTPVGISDATGMTAPIKFVTNYFYDFLIQAPGYGHLRFPRNAWSGGAGNTYTLTVKMAKNVASKNNGAVATGDGLATVNNLIDDTEDTVWSSTTGDVPDDAIGDQVTIALAGGLQTVRRIQVSAMLDPDEGGRFTALRQFQVLTCKAGVNPLNPTCSGLIADGFALIYTSPANAFPAYAPRPAAPDLILREFDIPDTQATHVKFRVANNQCTGQTAFQGEQDNDPSFSTDCRVGDEPAGLILPPADLDVRAAEFQVFATAATAPPMDPIVTLTMTAPATASRGTNIEYTLTYNNAGPFASSNAKITNVLPAELDFVSATNGGAYNAATRTVTWNLGTVNVGYTGTVKLTALIKPTVLPATVIINQADYTADLTVATPAAALTTVLP